MTQPSDPTRKQDALKQLAKAADRAVNVDRDLRLKVHEAYAAGASKMEIHKASRKTRRTIDRWLGTDG